MAAVEHVLAEMRREVRTQRVVVADQMGYDHVTLDAGEGWGRIVVRSRPTFDGEEPTCEVSLAVEEHSSYTPHAGIAVSVRGNTVGMLSIDAEGRPYLGLEDRLEYAELTVKGLCRRGSDAAAAR